MSASESDHITKIATIRRSDVKVLPQLLGHGAYAQVYMVKYRGITLAAKEIHQALQDGATSASEKRTLKDIFFRECQLCSNLSHPNIVSVIGIFYKTQQSLLPVMLMEMMDESVTKYIERLPKDAMPKRKGPILHDVAEGLKYLHGQKPDPIVHRDLTPNNILLVKTDKDTTVAKIGDFGVAKAINLDSKDLSKLPGTIAYMPPEAFGHRPVYSTSLDVFSYGAVALFVATHEWPTPDVATRYDLDSSSMVPLTEVQRRRKYFDQMEGEMVKLKPLVKCCLNCDRYKRPNMSQVSEELESLRSKVQV